MSAEFPVVAFLQNCWFKPGTNPELIRRYLTDQKFRRLILARSMSGGRLLRAFGEDDYRRIWWDNASEYVASTSPGKSAADTEHKKRVLHQVMPRGILCFGSIASVGMDSLVMRHKQETGMNFLPENVLWHYFPHPNARGLRQSQLDEFAREIKSRYLEIPS